MKSKGPAPDAFASSLQRLNAELLARLQYFALEPHCILDLGSGAGNASIALHERYRDADVVAVDFSVAMLEAAPRSWWRRTPFHRVAADARRLPFADHSVDLVYSNLLLPFCDRPDVLLCEVARVLKNGALFLFTSLGPDTLLELRDAWASMDDGAHVRAFPSLPLLGDALMHAGLAEPVMDTEKHCLHYSDVQGLLRELKASGAPQAVGSPRRGLTAPQRMRRMIQTYEAVRTASGIPATFEVIFGAAFASGRSVGSESGDAGEVGIPLGSIKKRIR